ncbi:DinB family protein [Acidobacteria bacterium AB60]|nr:DinB family protein [Acidobacteria bacterium AB60]
MESPEEYRKRLQGYVEGRDPLRVQAEAPARIARMIEGCDEERLRRRPAADKWSAVEIVAHMAEDELVSSWRYRQMLEQDGVTLQGFDQDLWARLGQYGAWKAGEAFALFRLLREANLRMLEGLSPEQWERAGHHVERGRITVRELVRHMAAHDINHLRQMSHLLGVGWGEDEA